MAAKAFLDDADLLRVGAILTPIGLVGGKNLEVADFTVRTDTTSRSPCIIPMASPARHREEPRNSRGRWSKVGEQSAIKRIRIFRLNPIAQPSFEVPHVADQSPEPRINKRFPSVVLPVTLRRSAPPLLQEQKA